MSPFVDHSVYSGLKSLEMLKISLLKRRDILEMSLRAGVVEKNMGGASCHPSHF